VSDVDVVVVGAGVGGLVAALAVAARGKRVRLYESAPDVGGKIGTVVVDGVEVDTGPSVLTLPDVLDAVFRRAGTTLADELTLVRPTPSFRYHFPANIPGIDASTLDVFVDVDDTLDSVRTTLGPKAADELRSFLAYARRIWEESKDNFVFAPAPTLATMARLALSSPRRLLAVDPLRTMAAAAFAQVTSPALRLLLLRYATYNGSDPYRAPATLHCIAHVELALGGFGVKGGMAELARALGRVASRVGVDVVCGRGVDRVAVDGGRVVGVDVDGARVGAHRVVVNADVGWLAHTNPGLLARPVLSRIGPGLVPSLSGATAIVKAKRRTGRVAHEVFFSSDYADENRALFGARRPPPEPTVYLCAQEKAQARAGWSEHEPLFVMVNVPPTSARDAAADVDVDAADRAALDAGVARAVAAGLVDVDDATVWFRSAADLARRFAGSDGSLYGAASNQKSAAFLRPSNRVSSVPGLYLASGSAHPGGGVPLCAQAGLLAADAVLADG
jgi:1-hydroxycarotenoid 3,4-desaturase